MAQLNKIGHSHYIIFGNTLLLYLDMEIDTDRCFFSFKVETYTGLRQNLCTCPQTVKMAGRGEGRSNVPTVKMLRIKKDMNMILLPDKEGGKGTKGGMKQEM